MSVPQMLDLPRVWMGLRPNPQSETRPLALWSIGVSFPIAVR